MGHPKTTRLLNGVKYYGTLVAKESCEDIIENTNFNEIAERLFAFRNNSLSDLGNMLI